MEYIGDTQEKKLQKTAQEGQEMIWPTLPPIALGNNGAIWANGQTVAQCGKEWGLIPICFSSMGDS